MSNNNLNPEQQSCFLKFFILIFLLVSLVGTYFLANSYAEAWESNSWIPVEASILDINHDIERYENKKARRVIGHCEYSYDYNNQQYIGSGVYFGPWGLNTVPGQAIYERLVSVEKVQAFINPDTPDEAVLVKGLHFGFYGVTVSLFMCYVITILCFLALKSIQGTLSDRERPVLLIGLFLLLVGFGLIALLFVPSFRDFSRETLLNGLHIIS